MSLSRRKAIRYGFAAAVTAVALVLLFGPTWIVPIHPDAGVPYSDLSPDNPAHLDARAPQRAMAVFVLCLGLWITHIIPLAATSLLAVALLPATGVMPHTQAFAYFGNSAVFFILGVFILAAAMIDTGLSKRLTLRFLQRFDKTPRRLVAGVFVCGSFFSLWMPGHAVAAMMYPLVVEVAQALRLKRPGSAYARSLFLALAWGTVIGSVGTYLGGARAILAVELYQKFHPAAVAPSFLGYAKVTMPLVVAMTAVGYFVITLGARFEIDSITQATRMLHASVSTLGPFSPRERRLTGLMIATIAAWILLPSLAPRLLGYDVNIGVIAVVSAVLVFVLRVTDWNSAQDYVNWGVVVMYGGAVALGAGLADTHAMDWLARQLVPLLSVNTFVMVAIAAAGALILTECVSNAAVVSILLPVGFGICHELGVSPLAMMFIVAIASGLAFSLPMSSPPNAIAFSSGYFGISNMIRRGIFLNLIAFVAFLLLVWLYWPLVGLAL
jgi:sodium-dependent dicarboxylate transporter 2/3/5